MVLDSTELIPKETFAMNPQDDLPRSNYQHELAAEVVHHFR